MIDLDAIGIRRGFTLIAVVLLAACGGDSNSDFDSEDEQILIQTDDGAAGSRNDEGVERIVVDGDCVPSQLEQDLIRAHNLARSEPRRCGEEEFPVAAELEWSCLLKDASFLHSSDMVQFNFFSHTGSNGLSPFDRMSNIGYRYRFAGENIAAGQRTVEDVVAGWLSSPGHCRNIMSANFRQMGGAMVEGDGRTQFPTYWTVNFGTQFGE